MRCLEHEVVKDLTFIVDFLRLPLFSKKKTIVDTERRAVQTGRILNFVCMFSTQRSRCKNEAGLCY